MDPFDDSGEAVLTVRGSEIARNVAALAGGGIHNEGSVALEATRLNGNSPDNCSGC